MFKCRGCLITFESTEEFRYKKGGNLCKTCTGKQVRNNYVKLKPKAISLLGGVCVKCGFSDTRALQVDHIDGNGFLDRKNKTKYNEANIYRKIIRGDTSNYQLLYANCNFIKAFEQGSFTRSSKNKNDSPLETCIIGN